MKLKKLFSVLLVVFIVFQMCLPLTMLFAASMENSYIPIEATAYAYEHYEDIVEVVENYVEYYDITREQLKDVKLGTPFVIYELNASKQDEIYYYPLLDSDNNLILLVSVIGTTEGWAISASEEWVDELNEISSSTSEFVFYKSEDNIYAENKTEEYCVVGEQDLNIKSFAEKSYQSKKQIIHNAVEKFEKADIKNIDSNKSNIVDKYTPAFSSSTTSSKICALNNPQGQGNWGLCWAASVATICNYLEGTNVSAQEVANEMGIGFNDGASIYEAQVAMSMFGVMYQNLNFDSTELMSLDSLRNNINYKYPVYVSAKSVDSGHAVTAYGYMVAAGVRYVKFWNSGEEDSITAAFSESGTVFTYNNKTFTWKYSLSMY